MATASPATIPLGAAHVSEIDSTFRTSKLSGVREVGCSDFFGRSECFSCRVSPRASANGKVLLACALDGDGLRLQGGASVNSLGWFGSQDRVRNYRMGARCLHRVGESGICNYIGRTESVSRNKSNTFSRNVSRLRTKATLAGDGDTDINGESIVQDYYSVLGLTPDATASEIKKAYYSCMKACHPDLTGNAPSVTDFCKFVNEVYEVLSDPEQRLIYDEINGFTLTAINPFNDTSLERDQAFVDEFTCIGCKNCAHTAPVTFEMEEIFGRARVMSQEGKSGPVNLAIETCPVDCIYWVTAPQLTLLEDEMRIVERVNVGVMLSGMGRRPPDIFTQASWKWDKRQAKAVERARVRMMREGGKNGVDAWWNAQWGSKNDERDARAAADKYSRERAVRTAAAARRWREYSRQGVDRRAVRNLPSTAGEGAKEVDEEESMTEKAGSK